MQEELTSSTNIDSVAEPRSSDIELLDAYVGEIQVRLSELPSLQPQVLPTRSDNPWRRFIEAGRRRTFTLNRDFEINIRGKALPDNLRGTVVIPRTTQGKSNVFDGASIPLPWIVSYLSFGVLRPLGILLVASVVHDFAFRFGYLTVFRDGTQKQVPVDRHDADNLFRMITATLNQSKFFSRLAWHAVRLGWWFTPYAGQHRTGNKPVQSTVLAVCALIAASVVTVIVSNTWLAELDGLRVPAALIGLVAVVMAIFYAWIWIANKIQS